MKKKIGRPRIDNPKEYIIKVREDKETYENICKYCDNENINISELVRKGVDVIMKSGRKLRGFEVVCEEKRKHKDVQIQLPLRGSKHSIAYDLYSPIDVTINPGDHLLIWTDIKAYFQQNEALLINVRSSMGSHPVVMGNSQGWIESDYYNNEKNDGNLGVNLLNLGKEPYEIKIGDRIGQAMFIPFLESYNGNTEAIRKGGVGSTGK